MLLLAACMKNELSTVLDEHYKVTTVHDSQSIFRHCLSQKDLLIHVPICRLGALIVSMSNAVFV